MMKNWLKRTLVGVAVSAALVGSVTAYSQGPDFHRGPPPRPEEMAQHEAHMLEHIGKSLKLDASQTTKLKALADQLHAQREAMGGPDKMHDRIQTLIAGPKFDRAGAQKLVAEKAAQIQTSGTAVIAAAADFYDSLSAAQQQQVRDFAAKHPGPDHGDRDHEHGHGGQDHGHEDQDDHGDHLPPPPPKD